MPVAVTAVIVDEWPLVRLGIAQALRTSGLRVAGEAGQGEEGLGKASASEATFLVIGAVRDLPVVEMVRRSSAPHVVVLLDRATRDDLTAVLSSGADAVLVRSARPEEVADAVARVSKGERVVAPMLLPLLVGAVGPSEDDDEPVAGGLTRKEVEVLTRLAQGLSNRDIADALYVTPATVKTHLAHIYAKLGVTGRQEAVAVAEAGAELALGPQPTLAMLAAAVPAPWTGLFRAHRHALRMASRQVERAADVNRSLLRKGVATARRELDVLVGGGVR